MIKTNFEKVKEFQLGVLQYPLPDEPTFYDEEILKGQVKHVFEEFQEFGDAFDEKDMVGCADALGDALYVIYGIAARMGLPMDLVFDAIHRANMRKEPGKTKRGMAFDAVKPAGWQSPDVEIYDILGLR